MRTHIQIWVGSMKGLMNLTVSPQFVKSTYHFSRPYSSLCSFDKPVSRRAKNKLTIDYNAYSRGIASHLYHQPLGHNQSVPFTYLWLLRKSLLQISCWSDQIWKFNVQRANAFERSFSTTLSLGTQIRILSRHRLKLRSSALSKFIPCNIIL